MQPQQAQQRGPKRRLNLIDTAELDQLIGLGNPSTRPTVCVEIPAAPAPVTVIPEPASTFEVPATLTGFFSLYAQYERKLADLAGEMRQAECKLFGDGWRSVINTPKTDYVRTVAEALIGSLVSQATTRYAPAEGSLKIEPFDVVKATGQENWQNEHARKNSDDEPPIDLDKIRAHLESTYGGDAGATAAFRQQAKVLIDRFGFNRDARPIETSRYVSCSMSMFSTKKDYGTDKGKFEVHYNYHEGIRAVVNALACVFTWGERYDLSMALRKTDLMTYSYTYKSRHRETFPGLDVVLFQKNWGWQFSHEAANILKLFLGQYGA